MSNNRPVAIEPSNADGKGDDAEDGIVDRLDKLAGEWAKLKKAPTLLLWLCDSIERHMAEQVFAELDVLPAKVPEIWIVLASGGGNLDSAYHVARLLQSKADRVCAVIPRWAKSAATLISIGCHEIVMHPLAELGPLDAQVSVTRRRRRFNASTLDALKSVEYLRTYSVDTFDRLMQLLLRRSDADYEACAAMASGLVAAMVEPIFGQIDPVEMGEHNRLLQLAHEYGERLMSRSYPDLTASARKAMLKKMVTDYPAHSFVIDLKEAADLGLRARAPTGPELQVINDSTSYFLDHELHGHDNTIAIHLPPPPTSALESTADGARTGEQPEGQNGQQNPS